MCYLLWITQTYTPHLLKGLLIMKEENGNALQTIFVVLFWALAILTWVPIGYGSYGPVPRIFGMPSWAVLALLIGFILFVVEWIYLFHTNLALTDSKLAVMLSALENNPETGVKS
ncbi:MAG: DUF997 domain-containing protein [Desulfatirhabdiaceae bacterium]